MQRDIMKINECPFCGSEETELSDNGGNNYQVTCCECEAAGPVSRSKTDAKAQWNEVSDAVNL